MKHQCGSSMETKDKYIALLERENEELRNEIKEAIEALKNTQELFLQAIDLANKIADKRYIEIKGDNNIIGDYNNLSSGENCTIHKHELK